MSNEDIKEKETIGMLLDIEHLYGEHEGRLAPILITLLLCGAPILFYIYFSLFSIIPIWLFIPIEIFISARIIMIIPGRESHRKRIFRKQLHDDYMNTAELMNIKTIHPDGCIEYRNSRIAYLVCCFNGTSQNDIARTVQLRKLMENMFGDFEVDIYIHNLNDSPELRKYYNKVKVFERNISAKNFVEMIDHSVDLTENTSLVQCTIYAIRGTRSDWKVMKTSIDAAVNSKTARCYKNIYRVDNPDLINAILNRNIDSVVNISDLLRRKYTTQQYSTSKVLAYDLPDDKVIVQGREADVEVIPKQTKSTFHVKYKE